MYRLTAPYGDHRGMQELRREIETALPKAKTRGPRTRSV
jgi:hypothetical protein